MNNNTALATIQQKYSNSNLLVPVSSEAQLNPFYKITVMEVTPDLSENSGDVFKVGTTKINNEWVDTFSPAKPLLMKLAAAAGIQFDPANTYGTLVSKNCYKAKAYGALRLPDGTGKTHCDEKVINLEDEEDRLRLEFMDKSIEGIIDEKAAKEAAKMFKGEWFETTNKWGKRVQAYRIANEDRQTYIDRSVMVNMSLLRKTAAEKAMTGAILRVIRALIGMKGQYTKEELKKPFAVARVTFNPDYNDPEVRRAMLSQGMNSVSNMFGAGPLLASPSEAAPMVDNFDPAEFAENPAFASDGEPYDIRPEPGQPAEPEQGQQAAGSAASPDKPICENCGCEITPNVAKFSTNKHGLPLCMKCQKEAE